MNHYSGSDWSSHPYLAYHTPQTFTHSVGGGQYLVVQDDSHEAGCG